MSTNNALAELILHSRNGRQVGSGPQTAGSVKKQMAA